MSERRKNSGRNDDKEEREDDAKDMSSLDRIISLKYNKSDVWDSCSGHAPMEA